MAYTLINPPVLSSRVGERSYSFNVAGPSGTVTMADGASGVFIPTTIALPSGGGSGNFTYTPTKLGAVTISFTNNVADTNPASFTYTGNAVDQVVINDFITTDPVPEYYRFPSVIDNASYRISRDKVETINGITYMGNTGQFTKN